MGSDLDLRVWAWVKPRLPKWQTVALWGMAALIYRSITTEYLALFGLGSQNLAILVVSLWIGGYYFGDQKTGIGKPDERQLVTLMAVGSILAAVLWIIGLVFGLIPVFN